MCGINIILVLERWRRLFSPKLRVQILDNNSPHGKFHRFLFPFSSKFPDLNFAHYYTRPVCGTNSEPGWPVVSLASVSIRFWGFIAELAILLHLSRNFVQNKMEQETPIPPNQGWSRVKGKNAPFTHPWLGGMGGLDLFWPILFWAAETWVLGDKRGQFTSRTLFETTLPFAIDLQLYSLKSLSLFAFWRSSPLR